jgi:hypothetical protein
MRFAISFLLLFSPLYAAGVITTNTTCSGVEGTWVTGPWDLTPVSDSNPTHCSVAGDIHIDTSADRMEIPTQLGSQSIASASAYGSYSLSGNQVSGEARGVLAGYYLASATTTVTISDTLTTDGPVREGIVRGYFSPSTFNGGGTESANVSVRLVSPVLPYAAFGFGAPPMTVELGHPFTLLIEGSGRAGGDAYGDFSTVFQLNFFEADGVTAVALREVSDAPEPSTWASLAGGLGVLAYWRRRKVAK